MKKAKLPHGRLSSIFSTIRQSEDAKMRSLPKDRNDNKYYVRLNNVASGLDRASGRLVLTRSHTLNSAVV